MSNLTICHFTSNNFNYNLLVVPSFANGGNLFVLPIFLYYIILYFIVLILFYFFNFSNFIYFIYLFYLFIFFIFFIHIFILFYYFILLILYCCIYFYISIKNIFIKCVFIQNESEIFFSIRFQSLRMHA